MSIRKTSSRQVRSCTVVAMIQSLLLIGGMQSVKVLHFAPINHSSANGFRFSVPGLVSAQNALPGIEATLVNIGDSAKLRQDEVERFDFRFFSTIDDWLEAAQLSEPDIAVFHGVYHFQYLRLSRLLRNAGVPYIVVPRSSLTSGAQSQKRMKKSIGNRLFFNRFIYRSLAIHYLTKNEYQTSKGFKHNHFIVGNGIEIPPLTERRHPDRLRLTYIGRYDIHHKGLDMMIQSLTLIRPNLIDNDIQINLYGSNKAAGEEFLRDFIDRNCLRDICHVHGPVYGTDKSNTLNETDVFLATSRFEGHPMAVLEAMAHGVPCIVTPGTNVQDVVHEYDAGWCPSFDKEDIARAILNAVESKSQIRQKGYKARKLVEERFSWEKVATQTVYEYEKLLVTRRE